MPKRQLPLIILCGMLPIGGCMMHRAALWITDGSTGSRLQFGYGAARGSTVPLDAMDWIRVAACPGAPEGRVVWEATAAQGPRNYAGTFTYGSPPVGFRTQTGPVPLTPGCYVAELSGEGTTAGICFTIDPNSRVAEFSPHGSTICADSSVSKRDDG